LPRSFLPAIRSTGNDKMGLYVNAPSEAQRKAAMDNLNASWWTAFDSPLTPVADKRKMRVVRTPAISPYAPGQLRDAAAAVPGSYWAIGNEPNVPGQDNLAPRDYAFRFKNISDEIKAGDPTAKIIAGNMLNWNFMCTGGCLGFPLGMNWFAEFWTEYVNLYSVPPTPDAWGIHVYTITWDRVPMVDTDRSTDQIHAFRNYLNSLGRTNDPIWITELGVIWGYDGWTSIDTTDPENPAFCDSQVNPHCKTSPCKANTTTCLGNQPSGVKPSTFNPNNQVLNYFTGMNNWLYAVSGQLKIARWFWYTQTGSPEPYATHYGGISLTDVAGNLTIFGEYFRAKAFSE
jgi:hypothetical protein